MPLWTARPKIKRCVLGLLNELSIRVIPARRRYSVVTCVAIHALRTTNARRCARKNAGRSVRMHDAKISALLHAHRARNHAYGRPRIDRIRCPPFLNGSFRCCSHQVCPLPCGAVCIMLPKFTLPVTDEHSIRSAPDFRATSAARTSFAADTAALQVNCVRTSCAFYLTRYGSCSVWRGLLHTSVPPMRTRAYPGFSGRYDTPTHCR